jgi:hypothetical protein
MQDQFFFWGYKTSFGYKVILGEKTMPQLTNLRETQQNLWKLGDALSIALRTSSSGEPPDTQWSVQAMGNSLWEVNHPDLDILQLPTTPLKLRINGQLNDWTILGQNELKNLDVTKVIFKTEDPIPKWNLTTIAAAAATFFKEQKGKIDQIIDEIAPDEEQIPKASQGGMGGGGMGMPMASRQLGRKAAKDEEVEEYKTKSEANMEISRIKGQYPRLEFHAMKVPTSSKYVITVKRKEIKKKSSITEKEYNKALVVSRIISKVYKTKTRVAAKKNSIFIQTESQIPVQEYLGFRIRKANLQKINVNVPVSRMQAFIDELDFIGISDYLYPRTPTSDTVDFSIQATQDQIDELINIGNVSVDT